MCSSAALTVPCGTAPMRTVGSGGTDSAADCRAIPTSSWGPNRLDVFVRGLDGALWHTGWTASGWFAWQGLGGALGSGPGAIVAAVNNVDVFARGTDGQLWSRQWNGSQWVNWFPLGGGTLGDPDATATGGRVDVVITGLDGALWHKTRTGTVWSGGAGGWHSSACPCWPTWALTYEPV